MRDTPVPPASAQDGTYPRPQLVRDRWADLSGTWQFDFDDDDSGLREGWALSDRALSRTIVVPFPPESAASGIGDTGYHRVLWYRRSVSAAELATIGDAPDRTLLLHFGAVDYRADVWIDGAHVAHHRGGHTPFTVVVPPRDGGFDIVVRAEDDPEDLAQPRGKQDWREHAHVVWYDRTSGIWQPVWLESVPRQHVSSLAWRTDVPGASVHLSLELAQRPAPGTRLQVTLRHGDHQLARQSLDLSEPRHDVELAIPALRNGQARDDLLWSAEHPTLIDAEVRLEVPEAPTDLVASYLGLRTISVEGGQLLLNDRPHRVRGVLSQGYWPQSHLAAPSAEALRTEAQLVKDLGFTTVRVHQKIEDPRFLFWADRLGLLVWTEMPSVYEFSARAVENLTTEWLEVLARDSSHPSIVVWVPFNESWGVQDVATDPRQQALVRTLSHLTRAYDGSRLVVSNDGWEHTGSDLLTVHDYENDAVALLESYGSTDAVRASLAGIAPNDRRMLIGSAQERAETAAAPVVLSEFGGVSIAPPTDGAWGYRLVESHDHLEEHLAGLFAAVSESPGLAGWCYTQLTDTAQETNGLTDENRVPKLPVERIRAMVTGQHARASESTREARLRDALA